MKEKTKNWLPYAKTPEEVGVSSVVMKEFIDKCLEIGKEVHSFMIIRNNKIACEVYREPFNQKSNHMMYSVSKSFTSTAIGFAIEEGYFNVDTRFVDIFPEARGDKLDEYLEELTVEDLLTMRSGKEVSVFLDKTKDRWFQDILASNWISEPGTEFLYISENMYLLCCIIHKVVGMSVMDYLKPRLFEPLGIEHPFWETCPRGVEAGGWGMMLTTEDLAKFTYCYQQKGKFGGKQVIPEWWVEEATKYHADTAKANKDSDSKVGYGYCFWMNAGCENSYRADGMFCQFGMVFKDYDAVFVMTGGEISEQGMRDVIWDYIPRVFIEPDKKAETVELSFPPYEKLPKKPRSLALESRIDGKLMKLSKPIIVNIAGYPVSVVPLTALFMESDKAGNINDVVMNFKEDEMLMSWSEGDEINSVSIGLDGEYRWDKIVIGQIEYNTCSTACWNTENELEVRIRCIEAVAERVLKFKFNGDNVVMRPSANPPTGVMAETLKETVKDVIKQKFVQTAVSKALPHLVPFVDAVQRGKIK
ncbi:MAG: serine hydrolase [Clostridia bacterium]|nr:serine hydrolase [Clostridia bacterium]